MRTPTRRAEIVVAIVVFLAYLLVATRGEIVRMLQR
jgi:hypothetical protein